MAGLTDAFTRGIPSKPKFRSIFSHFFFKHVERFQSLIMILFFYYLLFFFSFEIIPFAWFWNRVYIHVADVDYAF